MIYHFESLIYNNKLNTATILLTIAIVIIVIIITNIIAAKFRQRLSISTESLIVSKSFCENYARKERSETARKNSANRVAGGRGAFFAGADLPTFLGRPRTFSYAVNVEKLIVRPPRARARAPLNLVRQTIYARVYPLLSPRP